MFHVPNYLRNASNRLSQTLSEVGVNDDMRFVRQKTNLLMERMDCLRSTVCCHDSLVYYFGSQTEGSTTIGLGSDKDKLMCTTRVNVVQNIAECIEGKCNLLIVENEDTPPGYCYLKLFDLGPRSFYDKFGYDQRGNCFLQNTFLHDIPADEELGSVRQGPAQTIEQFDIDHVRAFRCKSWPNMGRRLVQRNRPHNQWPYDHMLKYSHQTGCFVVPTGNSLSENEKYEWRISTSQAERCFMFNMNITQLRCYTALKIIMKTIIRPLLGAALTSFQCKSMMMNLLENLNIQEWTDDRLIEYLISCLVLLKACVASNNCPHYFIPRNNLLVGRIDRRGRSDIIQELGDLINDGCRKLLSVQVDGIGESFTMKFYSFLGYSFQFDPTVPRDSNKAQLIVFCQLFRRLFAAKMMFVHLISIEGIQDGSKALPTMVGNLLALNFFGNKTAPEAATLMNSALCSTVGSMIASSDIFDGNAPTQDAMKFLNMGISSDMAAGRLKLASVLYCAGKFNDVEEILNDIESHYGNDTVITVCNCRSTDPWNAEDSIPDEVTMSDTDTFGKLRFASGVSFNRHEIHCVPVPLQYEMFRCTDEEIKCRGDILYGWNDWAVVDAKPFLYFLQYLTFKRLGKENEIENALDRLAEIIVSEPMLFHRETAMNLLGQCMEMEGHRYFAFVCYSWSLNECDTHNVARWHACILLWKLFSAIL